MSKLISLRGATIHFNSTLTPIDWLDGFTYEGNGFYTFNGSYIFSDSDMSIIRIFNYGTQLSFDTSTSTLFFYDFDDNTWYYVESPVIADFNIPLLNEHQPFINWVLNNAEIEGGTYVNDNIIIKNPLIVNKKSRMYDGTIVVSENE